MKNKWWIILVVVLLIVIAFGFGIYFITNKNNNNTFSNPYSASRTSTNEQNIDNSNENGDENNSEKNIINITENSTGDKILEPTEQIATFSTNIYSVDPSRQTNVVLTCSELNGTIIKNGTTFSFCETLGPADPAEGYQKADVFDKYGNKEKGIGGGKCQVSSTLYNAVLAVPNLVVTERHPHSNKVPYVPTGKDAAVSYGSYDLKFQNNTGFDIQIQASTDGKTVTTSLWKIN